MSRVKKKHLTVSRHPTPRGPQLVKNRTAAAARVLDELNRYGHFYDNLSHRANVRGQRLFYREAGSEDSPSIVLLHGFPSSSHMFRELIPQLADKFHVIAPDYVGFGYAMRPVLKSSNTTAWIADTRLAAAPVLFMQRCS